MALIRRIPWTSQPPPGTPIDRSNPITRGLVGLVSGADGPVNLVNGERGTVIDTGLQTGAGAHGISFKGDPSDATQAGWEFSISGRGDGDVECSLLSVASQVQGNSEASTDRNVAFLRCNSQFHYVQHGFDRFDGAAKLVHVVRDNASFATFLGGDFTVTNLENQGRVTSITSVDSTSSARVRVTGKTQTVTETLSPSIGSNWFPTSFTVAYPSSINVAEDPQIDDIYLVAAWTRTLSEAEHLALTQNPWILFQPRIQIIGVDTGGGATALLANDLQSLSQLSTPSLGQKHALNANDNQSLSQLSTPSLGQVHALLATDVESASELSTPSVTTGFGLTANDIESASELSTPSLGQIHALDASDLQSQSELSTPAITQEHALLATDVQSQSELSTPNATTGFGLTANDVQAQSELSTPSVGQEHALDASDLQSQSELSTPSLGVIYGLQANDLQSQSELSTPNVVQLAPGDLLAVDIQSLSQVSTPSLGQVHAFNAVDVQSGSQVSTPTLNRQAVTGRLMVNDIVVNLVRDLVSNGVR